MKTAAKRAHVVCRADQLPDGERVVAKCGSIEIGVFNLGGEYFALLNRCPHKSAPLCKGYQRGHFTADAPRQIRMSPAKEVIMCPWHGWEFEIRTGRSYFNPHRVRARSYEAGKVPGQDLADDPAVPTFPVRRKDEYIVVYV